jgi:O-antigen/teichoic acid export membrane protein
VPERPSEELPVRRLRTRELRTRAAGHRHLLTGSAVLVMGAAVQAIGGSVYWLIAARTDVQTDVGHATALFTSVLFVAFVAGLGLPVATARFAAGRSRDDHTLFGWAITASVLASLVLSVGYLWAVSPPAVDELRGWHGAAGPSLFAFLCIGTTLSLLIDVRLMTQRKWGLVLIRMSIGALGRFVLLPIPVEDSRSIWLLVVAGLPTALTGYAGVALMPTVTGAWHRLRPLPGTAVAMARYSAVNWLSTLTYQAPAFALPVIVLLHVDPDINASFYVAWGVANLACYVPTAIGQALLAEGGRDGAHVRSQVRLAAVVAVGLMTVGAALAWVGSDLVVTLYGEDYREAARILPALVGAAIPWAITSVYLTEARVRHHSGATVAITVTLSAAILLPALFLVPDRGLDGASLAFLAGNLAAAAVAIVAHLLIRKHPVDSTGGGGLGALQPIPADSVVPVTTTPP